MAAKAKRLRRALKHGAVFACSQVITKNFEGIAYRETCMAQPVKYVDINNYVYCEPCGDRLEGYKEKV